MCTWLSSIMDLRLLFLVPSSQLPDLLMLRTTLLSLTSFVHMFLLLGKSIRVKLNRFFLTVCMYIHLLAADYTVFS